MTTTQHKEIAAAFADHRVARLQDETSGTLDVQLVWDILHAQALEVLAFEENFNKNSA